jgi:hypothetical protein
LFENRNPKINITLIPPLRFTRPKENCKNATFAKNNKSKCKPKKTDPPALGPSASEVSGTSAGEGLAAVRKKPCVYVASKKKRICPNEPGYPG